MFNPKHPIQTLLIAVILFSGLNAYYQTKNIPESVSSIPGLSADVVFAKELLKVAAASISSIEMDCGFTYPGYLSRVFKREFGLTINGWRADIKERQTFQFTQLRIVTKLR